MKLPLLSLHFYQKFPSPGIFPLYQKRPEVATSYLLMERRSNAFVIPVPFSAGHIFLKSFPYDPGILPDECKFTKRPSFNQSPSGQISSHLN
jgi:hypothetical protein